MPKSAERVMRILDLCATARDGLKNVQIAGALHIPPGSLSILLSRMVKNGYLTLDPIGKRYTIGPQVLALTSRYLAGLDIVELCHPVLKQIVALTGEAASTGIRRAYEVFFVAKVDSTQPLSRVVTIGSRVPLHASASGKIFLAHMTDEELEQFFRSEELKRFTPQTITERNKLNSEFDEIAKLGIGYNREELNSGIFALAAPIFDLNGELAATLSVAVPSIRWNVEKEDKVVASLRDASRQLSRKLGYTGNKDYWQEPDPNQTFTQNGSL
ncbi:MAG: IclR family transcriptional regulator [Deltaproteobacteria bacterium]|jgi:DNA-binding IclR family transcriptional regulator|nr:IclR family transcriptional regulator [Deltaproteobacteria bacterium]